MLQIEQLKSYFPAFLAENRPLQKYMIKEYLQLMILDYLTTTKYLKKIVFIGGSNMRLIKGIDRFSEDLDFDCKDFPKEKFLSMTDEIVRFLQNNGLNAEIQDKSSERLKAFRRNIIFPEYLYQLGLSAYRNERFLIKIECQDQQVDYEHKMAVIKGCGLYFSFPVPSDGILCSMKLAAMLSRKKGRDFYDVMFLLPQTRPDYAYLSKKCGISNAGELKTAITVLLKEVNLVNKARDFEHLAFNKHNVQQILAFESFINEIL